MMLFWDFLGGVRFAVPLSNVVRVVQSGKSIKIFWYDGYVDDNGARHVEEDRIIYNDPDEALDKMRDFYKACQNNNGAFSF